MKNVVLTVLFYAEVPDDVDPDTLWLDIPDDCYVGLSQPRPFRVASVRDIVMSGEITRYETAQVDVIAD